MIRWETLNEPGGDRSGYEKDPKEVQVEQCLELYQRALRLHQKGRVEDAKQLYKQLVESEVMQEEVLVGVSIFWERVINDLNRCGCKDILDMPLFFHFSFTSQESDGNITTQSKPVALLQYLVYKNYASIVEEDDKKLPQRQDGQALQYYIKAVNVDPTDYNLWHRIGLLARSESRLRLARFAFESALAPATRRSGVIAAAIIATEKETAVDGKVARPGREDRGRAQSVTLEEVEPMQLGPVQWWCLEELCNVLYDIGDFSTCLYYVDIALAIHPDFDRGEWLKREIIRWEGAGLSGLAKAVSAAERTSSEMERHPLVSGLFMTTPQPPSSFALENQTWGGLGRLLLDVYDMVERSKDSLIDDYAAQTPLMFLNRRIEITLPVQAPIISTMSTADSSAATTGADVLSSGMTQTKSAASDNVDVDERSGGDSKMETSRSVIGLEESEPMVVDEDMGVLAAPTRKRKGSEEETEEKAEERRSLRTSKRVRDKLDHEELAKRRREDEERAFVTKVDAVLSKFSMSLACPGRIGIKQGQDEEEREEVYGRDEVTQFMEWMGSKVAAMGAGPGEDLSADIKAGGGTRQPTSIKRQYDIFTSRTGTDGSTFKEPLENFSALSDFIDDTNASNSGILDYLCRYVKRLIISNTVPGGNIVIEPTDSSGGRSGSLSEAAIKVLADVVVRLGEHLMRTMNSDLGCAGETDAMEIDDDSQEMADVDDKNQGIPEIGSKSSSEVMEYALAIAELVLDGAIALVISEAVQGEHRSLVSGHDTRGGRRSLGDAAREQKMAIERMLAVTRRWVTLFEREVERAGEGQALWLLKSDSSEEERESVNGALEAELLCDISEREHKNLVRQAEENVDAALHFLRLCRRLLNDRNCVVILSSCCYDSVISLAIIDARIQAIETQRYIVDADKRFLEKDHVGVVERLESLFSGCKPSNSSGANDSTVSSGTAPLKRSIEEKMRLIGMLADAYRALGQADKLWACYNHILGDVVRMLLWSGSEAMANDKAETDFWRSMKLLRTIFGEFMTSLETETGKDWISTLPGPERNSLIASVCVVLRSCLTYMFHHPAFALLLSADTEPSSPQGTSSKILSTVTIRSWVLFFLFVRSLEREQQPATSESVEEPAAIMGIGCGTIEETDAKSVGGVQGREDVDGDIEEGSSRPLMQREGSSSTIKDATSASSRVKRSKKMTNANMVTELLDIVHDELGQRELCNEDDGIFLRSALKIFADAGRQTHRREIFQCYYCLYNVHLSVDAESPVDHYTDSRPLDREAAAELFELLVPYVSEKVLKGTQMKSDVKDAFDDIVKQFGHPPSTNATLAMNKEVITHYLNSELPFPHTKDFPRWCSLLTTVDVDAERHKIPSIYFQIYFLRGKMFQGQVKNRAKLNQEKIMEDLKNAIEQYLFNLYLNPGHYKGWHALAVCYNGLAEEHLVWNASKIIHQNNQVADLQRLIYFLFTVQKSFHCFIQASKLFGPWHEETGAILDEPSLKALNAEVASHWCEFGYHLYSTTCSPMSMAAFKRRYPKPVMNSDGSRSFVEIAEPKEVHVYKFALMCFRIALQLDDNDWRQHYMIGKCFGKLGRKPKEILDCYKEAIRKTPMRSGQQGQEKILEPIYKLTSSLAKFLLNDVIDSSVVSEYLSYDTYSRTSSEEPEESSAQDNVTKDDQKSNEHRKSVDMTDDKASAFHHIFVKLSQIRGIDKRKWHHRPVYRVGLIPGYVVCYLQHAWLHYHVYNDPERAKMELQNLFSLKTTSKQFVNIWKPEFER
ncbi:hypothetical protein BC937DRAFT_86969 [Endogone sp. FLAS-F59071]|nr:hypothetical protein BC937DRAFT_86969 [Endogone sp. FLAS-F59071]|eukprot:RUS19756.1 hypothetical protein BC937DRAFT_86969 [Endogone sp. FLAS-F59071]